MISVVNGYVCTTSCEAAKARAGKDPFTQPGSLPGTSGNPNNKTDKKSGIDGQPATVLGGALKNAAAANAVTPANNAVPSNSAQPSVNLLA